MDCSSDGAYQIRKSTKTMIPIDMAMKSTADRDEITYLNP